MDNLQATQPKNETESRKPAAYFFFFLLPFLLFLLFFLIIRKNPLDFHLVFSDELDYWAQTATLIKQGLFSPNAGYFGYGFGNHAPFLYFGAHGFFSLIPYALFGFFVPRTQVTVLALNGLFLGVGLSTAYYVMGSFHKTLAIALALFAFYPFYLYFQTGMIEPLFYAGSIILAVLCAKSFIPGPRQKRFLNLYFWIAILFSLFRLSNLVFLIPAFFVEIGSFKRKVLPLLVKYGVLSVMVALLSIVFAATYPWGFLGELGKSNDIFGLILTHTVSNILLFFDLNSGYALEILPRFLFLSWLVFLCIVYILTKKHQTHESDSFVLSQILAMLALLLINVTLYDVGSFRDLRVLSPVLVFSMITFFLSGRGSTFARSALTLTVIFLLVSNFVVIKEQTLVWDLFISKRYELVSQPTILQALRYNPDAKTRWENTVYVDLQVYGSLDWKNFSPGIGIMAVGPEDMATLKAASSDSLPKARYIISLEPIKLNGYELTKTEQGANLYIRR
jgi:hypothetical protein